MPTFFVSDMTLFCRQLEAKAKQQRLEDRKEVCTWPLVPKTTLLDQRWRQLASAAAAVLRFQVVRTVAQPPAALHARHASAGYHHVRASMALPHLTCMMCAPGGCVTCAPGWVQRREELRQRLQLDKVLAPELEAQAAERDALAAQRQVRLLYGAKLEVRAHRIQATVPWSALCLSGGEGCGVQGSLAVLIAACQDVVRMSA